MGILNLVKLLFNLNGTLSGYKTYIAALAGILAVTADFLTGSVIPWIDGDIELLTFVTSSVPQYIALVTGFFAAGALRDGITKGVK